MENRLTTAEKITFRERNRHPVVMDVKTRDEAQEQENEAQKAARLSAMEKTAFGLASVFSAAILVILVGLTVVGFIFSPITHTLLFGLLAAATGLSSYVIWRGGKCRESNNYAND
jgi:uncharacterized membrane protein